MKILFLDDNEERIVTARSRFAGHELMIARTAMEAISIFASATEWDLVMLDHDLGDSVYVNPRDENCGTFVVNHILREKPKIKRIIVHSWNAPAARNMVRALRAVNYLTWYEPFGIGRAL